MQDSYGCIIATERYQYQLFVRAHTEDLPGSFNCKDREFPLTRILKRNMTPQRKAADGQACIRGR